MELSLAPNDVCGITVFLFGCARYIHEYASAANGRVTTLLGNKPRPLKKTTPVAQESVEFVRKQLLRGKVSKDAVCLTLRGSFYPGLLLCSGWWERENPGPLRTKRNDNLWNWLYYGFEQWGPSWNFSLSEKDRKHRYILGQIACGDELNSLPVVIPPEKAGHIRDLFPHRKLVFEANVTGLLCHRSRLSPDVLADLGKYGKAFDYCVLVDRDSPSHGVVPCRREKTEVYSGYLWQCLATPESLAKGKVPSLKDVFFAWEHTDLAKRDAIAYSLDALTHKIEYLRKERGASVLLQKSGPPVPGNPRYSADQFYESVLDGNLKVR